jgi:hypothetical protein
MNQDRSIADSKLQIADCRFESWESYGTMTSYGLCLKVLYSKRKWGARVYHCGFRMRSAESLFDRSFALWYDWNLSFSTLLARVLIEMLMG